jgi:hypothetical protein
LDTKVKKKEESCFEVHVARPSCGTSKSFYTKSTLFTSNEVQALLMVLPKLLNKVISLSRSLKAQLSKSGKYYSCYLNMLEMICGVVAPPCISPPASRKILNSHNTTNTINCEPLQSMCPKMCADVVDACKNLETSEELFDGLHYLEELSKPGTIPYKLLGDSYDDEITHYKEENNIGATFNPIVREMVQDFFSTWSQMIISLFTAENIFSTERKCLTFYNKYNYVEELLECPNKVFDILQVLRDESPEACQPGNDTASKLAQSDVMCPKVCVDGQSWMKMTLIAIATLLSVEFIAWLTLLTCVLYTYAYGRKCSFNVVKRCCNSTENTDHKLKITKDITEFNRLKIRQLFVLSLLCYVMTILTGKLRNILFLPPMSIRHIHTTIIILILWLVVLMCAFVTVSTMHNYHGILRYGIRISKSHSSNKLHRANRNEESANLHTVTKNVSVSDTGAVNHSTSRKKCPEIWLNCRRGPFSWYANLFGIRRGQYYFLGKLISEIFEWSLSLATLQSLISSISVQYTYFVIGLLLLNVIVSPILFVLRNRTPIMREIVFLFDTTSELLYLQTMSLVMVKQSDLDQPVYVLGFIGPFPALFVGIIWPSVILVGRFWSFYLGFLKNVIENKLEMEFEINLRLPGDTNAQFAEHPTEHSGQQEKRMKKKTRRRSAFLGLNFDKLEEQTQTAEAARAQSRTGMVECCVAFVLIVVISSMLLHAAYVIHEKDIHCGAKLETSSALWWGSTPRIVSRKYEEYRKMNDSGDMLKSVTSSPLISVGNLFVGYLDCAWDKIDSIVVPSGEKLKTIPDQMAKYLYNIESMDIRNNLVSTIPLSLFVVSKRLSRVRTEGNPLMQMLDLSNQTLASGGQLPSRFCNLTGWDIKNVHAIDLRNTSLAELPMSFHSCLPCLRSMYIGDNPIVNKMRPSLLEVWNDLDQHSRCTEASGNIGIDTSNQNNVSNQNTYIHCNLKKNAQSCKVWSKNYRLSKNIGTAENNNGNHSNVLEKCKCEPFHLNMASRQYANHSSSINNKKGITRTIDWSNLAKPLAERCTYPHLWEFLSLSKQCGGNFSKVFKPLTLLNLNCAGLMNLNLDVLNNLLSNGLTYVDLSENKLNTNDWGTFVDERTDGTISLFWKSLDAANTSSMEMFNMEATNLDDSIFSLSSMMYFMASHSNANGSTFFFGRNSSVQSLNWDVQAIPKANSCPRCFRSNVNGRKCCKEESFGQFKCGDCRRDSNEFRPPLWMIDQLASNLKSLDLTGQQIQESGTNTLLSLCSGKHFSSLRLENSFARNTIVPHCLWEMGTLKSVSIIQNFLRKGFKQMSENDKDFNSFGFSGSFPTDISNNDLINLQVKHSCTNIDCPMHRSVLGPYKHRINITGPLPLMPVSLLYLSLLGVKVSGTIPIQWCDIRSLQYLELEMTDIKGAMPTCMRKLIKLQALKINHNRYMTGFIPWLSIMNLVKRSHINIIELQDNHFKGSSFPKSFPSICNLKSFVISGMELNGTIPKNIVRCKYLEELVIGGDRVGGEKEGNNQSCKNCLGTRITGEIPLDICDKMCALTRFEYSSLTSIHESWLNPDQERSLINDTAFRNYCTLERWVGCVDRGRCKGRRRTSCESERFCEWLQPTTSPPYCDTARGQRNYPFRSKKLVIVGKSCSKMEPCSQCQGFCQSDKECNGTMKCFKRTCKATTGESTSSCGAPVPGCLSGGPGDARSGNFCT